MAHGYINDAHKALSEACQKEVEEMSRHPLSAEQKELQMIEHMRQVSLLVTARNKK